MTSWRASAAGPASAGAAKARGPSLRRSRRFTGSALRRRESQVQTPAAVMVSCVVAAFQR